MSKEEMKHTCLAIKDRSIVTLDGVNSIDSFDESGVCLATSDGSVIVEGQGLKIESLIREGGEIEISGRISGVFYTERKKKVGFLSKIFG